MKVRIPGRNWDSVWIESSWRLGLDHMMVGCSVEELLLHKVIVFIW